MSSADDTDADIPPPPMSRPGQYSGMDPAVRDRFHEMGNHLMVLHGILVGMNLRVPRDPAMVPLLDQRVGTLERGHEEVTRQVAATELRLTERVEKVDEKLTTKIDELSKEIGKMAVKIAGASAVVAIIGEIVISQVH